MPLTIDAGVISVAITVGANHAQTFKHAMIQLLASVIGAGIIALSILLTYRYAQRVGKWIGHTGMIVVVRFDGVHHALHWRGNHLERHQIVAGRNWHCCAMTMAFYECFSSRGDADFQDKLLSAMRYGLGGHL